MENDQGAWLIVSASTASQSRSTSQTLPASVWRCPGDFVHCFEQQGLSYQYFVSAAGLTRGQYLSDFNGNPRPAGTVFIVADFGAYPRQLVVVATEPKRILPVQALTRPATIPRARTYRIPAIPPLSTPAIRPQS